MSESLDVHARINSLCQIGDWIGDNKMLDQIKDDELNQIYTYLKPAYVNAYELDGMSTHEIKHRRLEISRMDTNRVSLIYEYCVSKLFG